MTWLPLALLACAIPLAPGDELPSVAILSPVGGTYVSLPVGAPTADVTVSYDVANWVYPALAKGVAFALDTTYDPAAPESALALLQENDPNPVLLSVPAGQHSLTACLVVRQTAQGGGFIWVLLDRDTAREGTQAACAAVLVNVALDDCWPTLVDPDTGGPTCNPAHPGACCLDTNPCSVESCDQVWADGAPLPQYQCRFEPAAGCCLSDVDCAAPSPCAVGRCVAHACTLEAVPLPPADAACCEVDADCDDGVGHTIDFCAGFLCTHEDDPLYCEYEGFVVTDVCPVPPPCHKYTCDGTTHRCTLTQYAFCDWGCPADSPNWCSDKLNPAPWECQIPESPACCRADADCVDAEACTTDTCQADRCRHDVILPYAATCPSGRCCESDADADRDGRADACETLDDCTPWACVNRCCVARPAATPGTCVTALDCDDADPATADRCEACACAHTPAAACDLANPACDDADPCTSDTCDLGAGTCLHANVPDCCLTPADCAPVDPAPCVVHDCDLVAHACSTHVIADCCVGDDACNDDDPCTLDTCVASTCRYATIATGCCRSDADCADADPCTEQTCVDRRCEIDVVPASPDGQVCCAADADCADSDPCTDDHCVGHRCQNVDEPECCHPDGQSVAWCDDGNACTDDWCVFGKCRHLGPLDAILPFVPPASCCLAHADCDDGRSNTDDLCADDGTCLHAIDAAKCDLVADPPVLCAGDVAGCAEPVCNPYSGACVCYATACEADLDCRVCLSTSDLGGCTAYNECYGAACVNGACVRAFDAPAWPACVPECTDDGFWIPDVPPGSPCDDGNPCTPDVCQGGHCLHMGPGDLPSHLPGTCCVTDDPTWGCDDLDPCTIDTCVDNVCAAEPIDGCAAPEPEPEQAEPVPDQAAEADPEVVAEMEPEPDVASEARAETADLANSDPGPSDCPVAAPEGACAGDAACAYGQACCDGACEPTVRCACFDGRWQCVFTGACQRDPDVSGPHEVVSTSDVPGQDATGGGNDGGSGGGCAWPGSSPSPSGLMALLVALGAVLKRRSISS